MKIIKNYKRFVNESVDPGIKSLIDVPEEVFQISKKISTDFYDKVKKPTFEFDKDKGVILKFGVTEKDFTFVDQNEELELDLNDTARKKRHFNVTLIFEDKISETLEVKYLVKFKENIENDENSYKDEEDEEDEDFIDKFELNRDEFDNGFDEEQIDRNIQKRIKEKDYKFIEDDGIYNEEFNPLKKEDWEKTNKYIKRKIGILTREEAIEKGEKIVMNHASKRLTYFKWSERDPKVAEEYLKFIGEHPWVQQLVWDGKKWSEGGIATDATGLFGHVS